LLGWLVLNLLARTSADPWLALSSAALLALPAGSILLRPPLTRVQAHLHATSRVAVGQSVEVVVRFTNAGSRLTPPVRWSHEHLAFARVEVDVPELQPGQSTQVTVLREALARGVHPSGTARLTSSAPFGLLRWSRTHEVQGPPVIVHPVTSTAKARLDGGIGTATESSVPVPGSGMEVLDLRPWRPGDARREVSARASARHGRPVVLQRERDAGRSLVVLAVGGGRGAAWEAAVSAAASITLTALWDGNPPVVLADPPPGRLDSTGVLDFFAGVDAARPLRQADLRTAVQRAGRGGTILLLAPAEAVPAVRAATAGCRLEVLGG
jgi:uncharacterized protein (DUF58 family)